MSLDSTKLVDPRANCRRLRHIGVGAAALIFLLAGAFYWYVRYGRALTKSADVAGSGAPIDPRLTYDGPFQNIQSDIAYVGDAKCAACHVDKAVTYREHPMGRSLLPVSRIAESQRY